MAHQAHVIKHGVSRAAVQSTFRRKTTRGKQVLTMQAFGTYFDPNWETIALDPDLGRMELRLLLLCATNLGKDNVIGYSQVRLAKKLQVTRQAVNQAMAVLIDKGLILQDGHTYHLNSRLATHAALVDLIDVRRDERTKLRALGVEAEL